MTMTTNGKARFPLGQIVATPGALELLRESGENAAKFLNRHVQGDFGEVPDEDRRLNNEAIVEGSRIMSAYRTAKGERLWVITEADRSSTCLLKPEEY
jgi:hypothetical protein